MLKAGHWDQPLFLARDDLWLHLPSFYRMEDIVEVGFSC